MHETPKVRVSAVEFDTILRKKALKLLQNNPSEGGLVVASLFYNEEFPDSVVTECAACHIPLYIRPWLLELAEKHKLTIVCQFCVDRQKMEGMIAQDFAHIEQVMEANLNE